MRQCSEFHAHGQRERKPLTIYFSTGNKQISNSVIDQIRTELIGMHGLVIQLKNGVGDLRAEWLLIKREVQGIKTETLRLQVCHRAYYRPRSRGDNTFGSVRPSVRPSVRLSVRQTLSHLNRFYWRGVVDIGTWLCQVQQKVQ